MAKQKKEQNSKASDKTRYSDKELEEFRKLIEEKMEASRKELKYYQDAIMHLEGNATDDTATTFKSFEDSSLHQEKEFMHRMAERQRQYIDHLEKALIRIKNKSYGICRMTGKLISKDRLRVVPHATLSIEAKQNRK